uniref:Uncharacterized protein n=1 Tax=Hucho hucho TaxID=62062 RepID=A0A4W5KEI1_9TELE
MCVNLPVCVPRSLSALSAYHSGVLTPMKMRSESQSTLRLYSGSPTHTDKDHVSISSFYYKERKPPQSGLRRWSIHDCPVFGFHALLPSIPLSASLLLGFLQGLSCLSVLLSGPCMMSLRHYNLHG